MHSRFATFLTLALLFLNFSCSRDEKKLNSEPIVVESPKPPIIDTSLTRETVRQLIQKTDPNELFEMDQSHGVRRINLDYSDCMRSYLAELKKEGIVSDIQIGHIWNGSPAIFDVSFLPQWQPYISKSNITNYGLNGWWYIYLDFASAQVNGIKQMGKSEANAEVIFKPNKIFEISQKYGCTFLDPRYRPVESKFRVKFELWDDGWHVASRAQSVERL